MQDFPHQYQVNASAQAESDVLLKTDNVPQLISAAPAQFDGPGDQWSPEHLLVASVADCFILTFRAIAKASRLPWDNLDVAAEGVLERVDRVTQFTHFNVTATLTVPAESDSEKARRLLEKAEENCMITNSLNGESHLKTEVVTSA